PMRAVEDGTTGDWKRNGRYGCLLSGETRVVIAGLPGGRLGPSIELALHEYAELLAYHGGDASTSLTRKGKERCSEGDNPQLSGKFALGNGLTRRTSDGNELIVVRSPRHLPYINVEGRSWRSPPISRNRPAFTSRRVPWPSYMGSVQGRIARALEEFPAKDTQSGPQDRCPIPESPSWVGGIVKQYWTSRCRRRLYRSGSWQEYASAAASRRTTRGGHSRAPTVTRMAMTLKPSPRLTWPKGVIPREVFENIASHLPRDSLEGMRLVSKEFEFKISPYLFRYVVIPLTPPNFGEQQPLQSEEKGENRKYSRLIGGKLCSNTVADADLPPSPALLIKPPIPPNENSVEIVKAFWGIYKWPHQDYDRYEPVEWLENFADDTERLRDAFSTLTRVMELGISLDNGLGWLNGPDVAPRVAIFKPKPKIFGPSSAFFDARKRDQIEAWRALLLAAQVTPSGKRPDLAATAADTDESFDPEPHISRVFELFYPEKATVIEHKGSSAAEPQSSRVTFPVMPNSLTPAQREWLLETDWAQRAFLNSYCLAVIDNYMNFQNLHSFNVARLPSQYLSMFCRADFWSSIGNVMTLSLGVIPEWREVVKLQTGDAEERSVTPSDAVKAAYNFLQGWVGTNRSIKTLAFGWIGGGENVPGIFARNRNVMAAPLFAVAGDMLRLAGRESSQLLLPHVKNLTLSNCWVSPAALTTFVKAMEKFSLGTLKLNSVSLSAGPSKDCQLFLQPPAELHQSWADGPFGPHPMGLVSIINSAHESVLALSPWPPIPKFECTPGHQWLGPPRLGSWPDVIEDITPGITLAALRYRFGFDKKAPKARSSNLRRIEFESCGYVLLPGYDFDQRVVGSLKRMCQLSEYLVRRKELLEQVMMSTDDKNLGVIAPYLFSHDRDKLQGAWGLKEGWVDDIAAAENLEDGQRPGGAGRFRGSVHAVDPYWGIFSSAEDEDE
ncbi:hypothetical protein GP486_006050, partial [Trichoglossum hirsutum]